MSQIHLCSSRATPISPKAMQYSKSLETFRVSGHSSGSSPSFRVPYVTGFTASLLKTATGYLAKVIRVSYPQKNPSSGFSNSGPWQGNQPLLYFAALHLFRLPSRLRSSSCTSSIVMIPMGSRRLRTISSWLGNTEMSIPDRSATTSEMMIWHSYSLVNS